MTVPSISYWVNNIAFVVLCKAHKLVNNHDFFTQWSFPWLSRPWLTEIFKGEINFDTCHKRVKGHAFNAAGPPYQSVGVENWRF